MKTYFEGVQAFMSQALPKIRSTLGPPNLGHDCLALQEMRQFLGLHLALIAAKANENVLHCALQIRAKQLLLVCEVHDVVNEKHVVDGEDGRSLKTAVLEAMPKLLHLMQALWICHRQLEAKYLKPMYVADWSIYLLRERTPDRARLSWVYCMNDRNAVSAQPSLKNETNSLPRASVHEMFYGHHF